MDNFFNETLLNDIRNHSIRTKPEECCGLLVSNGYDTMAYPTLNTSEYDKDMHFSINPHEYIEAAKLGKVLGFYHSHNTPIDNAVFSEMDLQNVKIHKLISVVYNTCTEQFYFLTEENKLNYLGRKFKIGESDCFSLIRDFFKNELKINIRDYERDSKWFIKHPKLWINNIENESFKIVFNSVNFDINQLLVNDILLIEGQDMGFPSHGAIYIGQGMILHHPYNRLSTIEPLCGELRFKTKFVVRYNG